MKKFIVLLLATTISFPCFALTETDMIKEKISCSLLNGENSGIKTYYKSKDCQKAINLLTTSSSSTNCREEQKHVFAGFINGLFEENRECLENFLKENKDANFAWALWGIYGDGDIREESTIKYALDKKIIFERFLPKLNTLSLLSGYYYATGNRKVLDYMQEIIQSAKEKDWCYPVDKPNIDGSGCPYEGSLEHSQEMLARVEERLKNYKENDNWKTGELNLKKRLLEDIEKAKSEKCIQAWKYSHCPDQETLYFAAEFLKRYDTNWYNQNVKNWMAEKEKIYLVRDKKEAEKSAKRIAENERKRAERKKADDELRKMGVDLDGDTNKIGIIMYNPKTGKTQKF